MASYPPVQPRSLYRAIIRELRLSDSIHTFRSHRTSGVLSTLRNAFRSSQSQFSSNEGKAQERQFVELAAYLRANRLHQLLVERYNAGVDMTQEERSRLSARRVGLNMPEEYSVDNPSPLPGSTTPPTQS